MTRARAALRTSELSESTFPRFRDDLLAHEAVQHSHRSHPGVERIELPRPRARLTVGFDRIALQRRTHRVLGARTPSLAKLGRLLYLGHGASGPDGRGPAPSAGHLQPIELYAFFFGEGTVAHGAYHYDRAAHGLSRIAEPATRDELAEIAPSFGQVEGGSALLVLVGDTVEVDVKYGVRAPRFLLLEAGHVMQALALAATSVGCALTPLGGVLEPELARRLTLPSTDAVLYCALLGEVD